MLFQVVIMNFFQIKVSNGLFRIIENGKIGFANMDGQIIIKPQFNFIFPFRKTILPYSVKKELGSKYMKNILSFLEENGELLIKLEKSLFLPSMKMEKKDI